MGGFNVNLPGLNFNLTPEAIDAARAAQGLPPLNPPPVAAPPPGIPVALPPVASPAGDPTIIQSPVQAFAGRPEPTAERPIMGQGVGSFLLNERFGQNIPVEPRILAQPIPAAAPPPPPVAPPPVMPMADSEGVTINIQPPQQLPPAPVAPPAPQAAPAPPPPVMAPPPPVEQRVAPLSVAPVTAQGIGTLTAADVAAAQVPGLEGFDPANPLNPVVSSAAPAADDGYTPPAVGGPGYVGSPPIGYQGGGGEYDPSDGYTDEDRIAEDAFYASQTPEPVEGPAPAPEAPDPVEAPAADYVEIPEDDGEVIIIDDPVEDSEPPVTPYDPEPTPDPLPPASDDDDLFTPVPTQPSEDTGQERTLPPRETTTPGGSEKAPEPEPEVLVEPVPSYRYTPYVPAAFQYLIPEFARGRPGASGPGFTGGTSYEEIEAPEVAIPPMGGQVPAYSPVPAFQVARPEYVQIEGPSAPVVDPFATPIQPEFAPLPSYERASYSPQTQKMIDQILSEEEMANPFMNPYLRTGPFGQG